jgi:inner membrane protein
MSLLAGALIANAADLDFLLVAGLKSKAWHRGFTHSIVFAFLICFLFLLTLGREQFRNALGYGLAFSSHGLLDYVTSKNGGGVELLWPFSTSKFTLGWWGLSEVPSQMTTMEILEALAVEAALFSLLFLAILVLRKTLAKRMSAAI